MRRSLLMRPLTMFLILMACLFSLEAVGAQAPPLREVYVQVVNQNGEPLPGVWVHLSLATAKTNATGVARLYLISSGKYPVVVEDAFGTLLLPQVPDIAKAVQVNQSGQTFQVQVDAKRVCLEVVDAEEERPSWVATLQNLTSPRMPVEASDARVCMGLKEYTGLFLVSPFYRMVSIPAYALPYVTNVTLSRTANLALTAQGRRLEVTLAWEGLNPANLNVTYALILKFAGFDGRSHTLPLGSFVVKTLGGERTWRAELPSSWGDGVALAQVMVGREQTQAFRLSRSWITYLLYSAIGPDPLLERALVVGAGQEWSSFWTMGIAALSSTFAVLVLILYFYRRRKWLQTGTTQNAYDAVS